MTSVKTRMAYNPKHRHEFTFEERKNGSVIIGPCDLCGLIPSAELKAQDWEIVDAPVLVTGNPQP